MFRALYTAASGMNAQQLNLDNVANNLANSSTSGFRRRRLQFTDLLYQNIIMPGSASTSQTTNVAGLQVGLGTKTGASEVLQLQGDFSQTGNPLDLAIQGPGFFQVSMPDGSIAYTRSGTFHMDAQGNIVTADGNPLEPAITLPADALLSPSARTEPFLSRSLDRRKPPKLETFSLPCFPMPADSTASETTYSSPRPHRAIPSSELRGEPRV